MSLMGYECACVDRCKCFDHIKADPTMWARMKRLANAVERFICAEVDVDSDRHDALSHKLESIAEEFGL